MANVIKTCRMLFLSFFLVAITVSAYAQGECTAAYGTGSATLRLATGSPGELGLVEVLANAFNESLDSRLCWKKAGSGASLKLLKGKQVDFIMVHAPAAEKKAVEEGWAIKRHLIGSNEF